MMSERNDKFCGRYREKKELSSWFSTGEQWKPRRLQLQETPAARNRDRQSNGKKPRSQESEGRRSTSLYMAHVSTLLLSLLLSCTRHGPGVDRSSIVSPFRRRGACRPESRNKRGRRAVLTSREELGVQETVN